ncbi:hypothetical protein A2954_05885 [Candidatus Roizmanbacteria bacterium RIFCSPLOWO2_01_FULL_37_12]|uniref:Pyruvoyl-dependent arginine decarboxylase AaxB n=1 Tax=Candidatus Roizmanbacteria bacterium RIFCSPLOWO2_01_FULL_37_12 TaxID=1802056 RepID=A0A1F7IBU4_9BACT|nr:MAG: hypothetical protein A2768_02625 [Candidatus Roizmanbacteria bacterium RIFCSPHIGHO2_01_FULL_37_16]OGK25999.1 MAG: hypothetical protein A3D76_03500 [Candidatus Roizmanbacteria bacterium RIFCSPHIGHO2_02_FULL_37_9b]OGK40836.1 MAG: hypothetical protein A2954_05885 [Candidatus Roizmanbacteria bacterium RIFCSPLOWO2_01_FULL_37_12]
MEIVIASGSGHGKTPLSAFDAALKNAGVHNYNLLYISSIIPKGSVLKIKKLEPKTNEYGHRLYVVKAEMRSRETGKYIGAALGWYQLKDGRGVFVEHEEIAETEESVRANLTKEIYESLTDLCRVRSYPLNKKSMKIKMSIVKIENSATSVLVLAVYKSEGWDKNRE